MHGCRCLVLGSEGESQTPKRKKCFPNPAELMICTITLIWPKSVLRKGSGISLLPVLVQVR